MPEALTDLAEHLQTVEIVSSAPCRLDVGGTWDLKCFALPYASLNPATTNIAISARTRIRLKAYRPGWVRIVDEFHHEAFPVDAPDMTGHFGLLFAIAAHFALGGVEIEIAYGCPPRSGVGGSGTLSVALAGALARARKLVGGVRLSPEEIIEIVYNIEDGLRYSYTGLQDQCAATYGGVNTWSWTYGDPSGKFRREAILTRDQYSALSDRLLVAYIGKPHDSNDVNSRQVDDFLAGRHRSRWFRVNEIAREFAEALKRADWEAAGRLMDEETATRCAIVPARMTVIGEKLQGICNRIRGGVRYRWQRQRRVRVGAGAAPRGRFRPLGRVAGGPVRRPHGTNPSRNGRSRWPRGQTGCAGMRRLNTVSIPARFVSDG